MRSLSGQAQRFSRSLDRRIPALCQSCRVHVLIAGLLLFLSLKSGAPSIGKKSAALTGPVMTLLDLVVHVPVNCGSVCADTKDRIPTPAASDDRSDTIMEY